MITTAAVMGSAEILGQKIKNSMDWHVLVLQGIPVGVLSHMNKKWDLTDEFIAQIVGVSTRTVSRKRKRANISAGERLSLVQGDRLYRVARIIALAVDVFEDEVSALKWLNRKQAGLGNRVPLYMLQTAIETAEVENLLCHLKKPLQ